MIHETLVSLYVCGTVLMVMDGGIGTGSVTAGWMLSSRSSQSMRLLHGVMQGVATPHFYLNDQQSPHHFALKPSQVTIIATG